MKSKTKKNIKKLIATPLAIGMIATSTVTPIVSAQNNDDVQKAIKSINEAVKEKAQLEMKVGFDIAPDVDTKTPEMVSVIVELKEEPIAVAKSKNSKVNEKTVKEKVKKSKDNFKNDVAKMKKTLDNSETKIEFGQEYDTVFNGIAVTLPGTEVEKLLESEQVKTIWNNAEVKIDLPKENEKAKTLTDTPTPFMVDSINDIGVDKLHSEGIKGEGMKIGVLDTGIDYNHPDLTENYKGSREEGKSMEEVKGWDFVDGDSDPMETTRKDWKESGWPEFNSWTGSSYYTSHGTHVSGTIAGNGASESEFAITGVAPEADLYGYRVLGPYGSGSTENIIAAINKAVEDEMDVINLSLGSGGANPYSPLTIACNNAIRRNYSTCKW